MLKQIFLCILSLSLSGALTGLLVLLIRSAAKRLLSKRWNYYIWLLVIGRLMIPVSVEIDFWHITLPISANEAQKADEILKQTETLDETEKTESAGNAGTGNFLELTEQEAQKTGFERTSINPIFPETDFWQLAGILWIIGAVISFLIKIKDYRKFTNYVKKDWIQVLDVHVLDAEENVCRRLHMGKLPKVFETGAISGPITIGIFHHELVHVKRKDLWYKWIYQILLCIHWFNPMLYLIGRRLNTDCELSCDEAVLACLTKDGKKAYGNILLDVAQTSLSVSRRIPAITLLERKQDLKERLKGILQYKEKSGFKVLLSVFLAAGLITLSACSSVEAGLDSMPVHIAGEDWGEEYISFWDEMASWMIGSSVESFLAEPVYVNKNGDAWRAYEDDELIAGADVTDQYHMYTYKGGKQIECNGMFLNGTNSVLIVNASKETEIQVKSVFEVLNGKFKLVHVLPDGTVEVVNETGEKETSHITMNEGRNVIKFVGQESKVRDLKVDFSFHEKDFETVFYSEDSEQAGAVKERIKTGEVSKEEIMKLLYYMEDEDVSQAFAQLLKQGVTFDKDELIDMIIYSDSELSGRYYAEAVCSGEVEAPTELVISDIKYYLGEDSLEQLLLALEDEITFDILYDCAPYLSRNGLEKCLTQYMEAGNQLTGLQFQKISFYLDEDTLNKIKL